MRLTTTNLLKAVVLRNWRGETETVPFISADASHDLCSNSCVTFISTATSYGSFSKSHVTFVIFLFFLFLNYVQHSTNIRDRFFLYFKRQRIPRKIIRALVPWTTTSKKENKIKKKKL